MGLSAAPDSLERTPIFADGVGRCRRAAGGERRVWVCADGEAAHTDFDIERRFGEGANAATWLVAYPQTGHTHQTRVYAAHDPAASAVSGRERRTIRLPQSSQSSPGRSASNRVGSADMPEGAPFRSARRSYRCWAGSPCGAATGHADA